MPNKSSRHRAENIALVLQGGGALGSYQAGAYQALHAANLQPDWIAGISIGAINAAIIAGNLPQHRVEKLRAFWNTVSSQLQATPLAADSWFREIFNGGSAALVAAFGVPGFFSPRIIAPFFATPGSVGATSYYDTAPLEETLSELVDFDLLNSCKVRLSVGAVNVKTGNMKYFDSATEPIGVKHILASCALPPAFGAIEIGGEQYWDGGLVSNTPLQYVLDQPGAGNSHDQLIFQVDLFSALGPLPRNLSDVGERCKDIQFSSRTRFNTDQVKKAALINQHALLLRKKLPAKFASDPDLEALISSGSESALTVVHLIHRSKAHETESKDHEFSRHGVNEHWHSGAHDVNHSLKHPLWRNRTTGHTGILVLDLAQKPLV